MSNNLQKKKNNNVLIAVVLVNYNGFDDTLNCIKSLNKVPQDIEIIVIDNASSESNRLKELEIYENVSVIRQQSNLGFGRANNIGIQWAIEKTQCSHILVLNNDTQIEEDTLTILLLSFNFKNKVGIVAPKILLAEDENYLWYGGAFINWYKGSVSIPGYGYRKGKIIDESEVDFASGCAMLFSRESMKSIGGFDPRFFMYEEDFELSIRATKKGWVIVYNPKATIIHKGQGSQRNKNEKFFTLYDPQNPRLSFLLYHVTKNKLLTIAKHASGIKLMKFVIGYPPFLIKNIFRYILFGRWSAIKAIALGIRDFLKERKNDYKEVIF